MKQIKAYQCDFCKFYKKTKLSVENHEEYCYHNPKNKACATCDHNIIDYETMSHEESPEHEPVYNWCKCKNIALHRKTLKMNCSTWIKKEILK